MTRFKFASSVPLTRYHGVLAPRSRWRPEIVPRAPELTPQVQLSARPSGRCASAAAARERALRGRRVPRGGASPRPTLSSGPYQPTRAANDEAAFPGRPLEGASAPSAISVAGGEPRKPGPAAELLAPNTLGVRHWSRLLGGLLYAASPRLPWSKLLRRTFDVDILDCVKCHGRLQLVAVITATSAVRSILERLDLFSPPPQPARARDPTLFDDDSAPSV
jgi:hypothetical protein